MKRAWQCRRGPLLVAALMVSLSACGKSNTGDTGNPEDNLQRFELHEIASLFKTHQADKGRPPAKLADLEPYEAAFANGFEALRKGRCLAVWGVNAGSAAGSATLLAYQKEVLSQGGYVIMADETVKKVSSDEFKALRKPRS